MIKLFSSRLACIGLLVISSVLLRAEWPTFGHDPQRSGWAREETKLTLQTAKDLELKWSIQLDNVPLALDALTAPVTASNVVTSSGHQNNGLCGG